MNVYRVQTTCEKDVPNRDPRQIYPAAVGTGWEPDTVEYFDGKPYPKKWRVPAMKFDKPRLPKPDFFCYTGKLLLCNRRAVELLGDVLRDAGELFPVKITGGEDGGPYHFVNVTRLLRKALDPAKSVYRDDRRLMVPAFRAAEIPDGVSLFKIPQNFGIPIYCAERTGEPGPGEFKALVEQHGLKGLEFQLIWTDGKGSKAPATTKTSAKPKATGKGRRASAAAAKPGGSDRPLKPSERKDVEKSIARGYEALDLPPGTPAAKTQKAMRVLIDQVVDGKRTLTPRAAADLSVNLGCLWGQAICDAAGWEWCSVKIGRTDLISVARPDRSYVVRPMHFIQQQLHKRLRGDNASLLLFNMIKGNSLPAGKPKAYVTVG